jgi:hypothetical protein
MLQPSTFMNVSRAAAASACCSAGISAAHWDDTDEDVTITLSISEPIGTLGAAITEVIQSSDLNALLDRPLEVQISS